MDLLELNKRGMDGVDEDEDYNEGSGENSYMRASR